MSQNKVRLWNNNQNVLDETISSYIFSKDLSEDKKLLKYDIQASSAHAKMLGKVGILSQDEVEKLILNLKEIDKLGENFDLTGFEDIHSAIENFLTKQLGDLGKKIHTGRSRNDQVLVAIRLFIIANLQDIIKIIEQFSLNLKNFAKKYEFIPMPGFTHMQHAMPSSIGQWAGSFLESLSNDITCVINAINLINQNPLGSAAGFGTSIPVDREFTTKEMGFNKTMVNTIFCQNSRGKFEIYVLSGLMQLMMTLEKMANDIVIFCSQEFGFFIASEKITTGSSIMPQKRNLDAMEVMRAKSTQIFANITQLTVSYHNLISGYNKDMKFTKKVLMESLEIAKSSVEAMNITIQNIIPNEKRLLEIFKNDPSIFATDVANQLVLESKMSFRDAYHHVKNNLSSLENINLVENIKSKKHIGATGNLMLDEILEDILKK